MDKPRVFLDVSTLLRHWENADGISRTVSKFADFAIRHLPDVEFVYLGGAKPLRVRPEYLRRVISGDCRIDLSYFPDPADRNFRHRLPRVAQILLMWLHRPRRRALVWTDRIAAGAAPQTSLSQWLRARLLSEKYRRSLTMTDGSPIRLIHHDLAFEAIRAPGTADVVMLAGSDWKLMTRLAGRSERPKLAALCYDIIPLLFPQFFPDRFVAVFRECVENVFGRADLTVFTAHQVASDTCQYLQKQTISNPPTAMIPLGADSRKKPGIRAPLPPKLASGKYALFVSTIEPRKNHRLIFDVWISLLDEGVPQTRDFKLVFVGRKGWMTEELVFEMTSHPSYGSSLLILSDVDDDMLATLYAACAFTIYPSLYEGFGLPIIESFLHGKAVIASSAGALRETVNGLSPCFDPHDETAWRDTFRQWISDPSRYELLAKTIRSQFVPQSWDDAAANFFQVIGRHFDLSTLTTQQGANRIETDEIREPLKNIHSAAATLGMWPII